MGCFAPASAVEGRLHRAFSPISARQLSVVSCGLSVVRYWPDRGLVFECVTRFYCRFIIKKKQHFGK